MSIFKIPDYYKAGFEEYSKLSESIKLDLCNHIKEAPIGYSSDYLISYLKEKIAIDPTILTDIVESLFSVFSLKLENDLPLDVFVREFVDALKEEGIFKENLENELIELLSIKESIFLTLKAYNLANDRGKILINTRIVTDIRPLFGINEESDDLKGNIITHNLKVSYKEDSQDKSIYFALDTDDLIKLKEEIIRAERKELTIKSNIDSNINIIEFL